MTGNFPPMSNHRKENGDISTGATASPVHSHSRRHCGADLGSGRGLTEGAATCPTPTRAWTARRPTSDPVENVSVAPGASIETAPARGVPPPRCAGGKHPIGVLASGRRIPLWMYKSSPSISLCAELHCRQLYWWGSGPGAGPGEPPRGRQWRRWGNGATPDPLGARCTPTSGWGPRRRYQAAGSPSLR